MSAARSVRDDTLSMRWWSDCQFQQGSSFGIRWNLVLRYAPDRCGSWWLGASEEDCTLIFYVASRTLAAFLFLLGPVAVLCLIVSFGVFWTLKARGGNR